MIRWCVENKDHKSTYIIYRIVPLVSAQYICKPLRYFHETLYEFKHDQTMRREQEPNLHLHLLLGNYVPLKILIWKSCRLDNAESLLGFFFTELGKNIKHHLKMSRDQVP